jgi:hypothetical protein
MNKNLPENFVSDPYKILKKARSKLRPPHSQPTTLALGDSEGPKRRTIEGGGE